MAALQKINLGAMPSGAGGDSYRGGSAKNNANVDVLNAQAALITGGAIYAVRALTAADVGKRWSIALTADGTINLPVANTCPVDSVLILRNTTTTKVTVAVAAGSGNIFSGIDLNIGESVFLDTDGSNAWRIILRGRSYSIDEFVRGKLTAGALTVNGTAMFTGPAGNSVVAGLTSGVGIGSNTGGDIVFKSGTAAADCGIWDIQSNDNTFSFRTISDGWKAGVPWMLANRGAGNLVDSIQIAPNSNARTLIGPGLADDKTSFVQIGGSVRFAGTPTFQQDVTCTRSGGGFSADDSTGASHSNFYLKHGGNPMWGIRNASTGGDELQINAYDPTTGLVSAFMRGDRTTRKMTVNNMLVVNGPLLAGFSSDDGKNKLQVAGSVRATNYALLDESASASGYVGINAGANADNGPNIAFYGKSTATNGAMLFSTNGAERMRITNGGRVAIGGADDGSNTLQVYGTAKFSSSVTVTSPNSGIELGSISQTGTPFLDFHTTGQSIDYDARIIAQAGATTGGATGTANLTHIAAQHQFQVPGSGNRMIVSKTGTQFYGATTFSNYSKASLPVASDTKYGAIIVNDAAGGPKLCISDGTNWCIANTTTVVS